MNAGPAASMRLTTAAVGIGVRCTRNVLEGQNPSNDKGHESSSLVPFLKHNSVPTNCRISTSPFHSVLTPDCSSVTLSTSSSTPAKQKTPPKQVLPNE